MRSNYDLFQAAWKHVKAAERLILELERREAEAQRKSRWGAKARRYVIGEDGKVEDTRKQALSGAGWKIVEGNVDNFADNLKPLTNAGSRRKLRP